MKSCFKDTPRSPFAGLGQHFAQLDAALGAHIGSDQMSLIRHAVPENARAVVEIHLGA